ncbi:MAG TPA: S41 family peptidase [Gammaproteobacteria bacterium]|nr:S41 family peptidase [Gammaproteobacteria bacterium]
MQSRKRLQTLFILFLGIFIGVGITLERISQAERDTGDVPIPYEQLQQFSEVYSTIKDNYVEEVSDDKLIEGAINGMLQKLDPHSAYLTKDMLREMQVETEGKFGGLGIEVTTEDGFIKVVSPIEGTPADKAGLEAGDLIVRIDGKPSKDLTLMEAVKQMRGEPGTDIELSVVREGFEKPRKFTITRDIIRIESVKSHMLTDGIGYVRITQFQQDTGAKTREAVNQLKRQAKGGLKGLVIDLRNNPGGVLSAAVETADAFITQGKIVYTKGRVKSSDMTLRANSDDVIGGAPIVTLVNGGSASASEIVSGALQDRGRAIIMGTSTFGKGSVQSIMELDDGAGLKLTTARYFTPKGRSIQAEGISPDIVVRPLEVKKPEDQAQHLKEKDLPGHLQGDGEGEAKDSKAPSYLDDYQLSQAVNLLRGVILVGSKQAS